MSYYKWYCITDDIWFNTMYVYDDTTSPTTYETFNQFKKTNKDSKNFSEYDTNNMELVGKI